jgi:hypothetical protein
MNQKEEQKPLLQVPISELQKCKLMVASPMYG